MRRYLMTIVLFVVLVTTTAIGGLGWYNDWSFTLADETFWLLITAIVGVFTFLGARSESTASRRIQLQLSVFDRWQRLSADIEDLEGKANSPHAKRVFRRYFELVHIEYQMSRHIDRRIWKYWTQCRVHEFQDQRKYAAKTRLEWWKEIEGDMDDKKFREYMKRNAEKARKRKTICKYFLS